MARNAAKLKSMTRRWRAVIERKWGFHYYFFAGRIPADIVPSMDSMVNWAQSFCGITAWKR